MSNTWIKICGITQQDDALAASDLGANAIGLVFYPASPRGVSVEQISGITSILPEEIDVVALFVDASAESVREVVETGKVQLLQFHGSETPDYCESFGLPYMKAFRVGKDSDLPGQIRAHKNADRILLDAYSKEAPGGTGKTFDWEVAKTIVKNNTAKLVLAGGLSPQNIHEAVVQVRPFGVDVSSGVESAPGEKDKNLIKEFIEGVRSVSS